MSEEYRWRQLGSAVNAVLAETRMRAMRNGSIARIEAHVASRADPQPVRGTKRVRPGGPRAVKEKAARTSPTQPGL